MYAYIREILKPIKDGVCDRIQVDNAKCFVTNASRNNFVCNTRFLHLCGFYGIKPTRSIPGHPWSKGKVENPFSYLETHFITGKLKILLAIWKHIL